MPPGGLVPQQMSTLMHALGRVLQRHDGVAEKPTDEEIRFE